jgi:hypothetical protein
MPAKRILAAGGDPARQVLTLIPTRSGHLRFLETQDGECWRTYLYIEGARSYDVMTDLRHVYSAARAFGQFQVLLDTLPAPSIARDHSGLSSHAPAL